MEHRAFAALYDVLGRWSDAAGMAERRRQLLSRARGRVLEVGGGTGLNLPHYRDVSEVVVLEPDAAMRRRLLPRVRDASVPVEIHEATIEEADFPDASFDTVVCTLVLCTVADLSGALGQIHRVLRPDGELLFLEHVRASGWRARAQTLATPVWSRLFAGCRLDRSTTIAIRNAGFTIPECRREATSRLDPFLVSFVEGVATPRVDAGQK